MIHARPDRHLRPVAVATPAPPPLDPARRLHVQAFAALIDQRLDVRGALGLTAPRLLIHLVDAGIATLDTPAGATPNLSRLTLLGITATGTTAEVLLRNWQSAALTRLAPQQGAPTITTIRGSLA